MRSRQGLVPGLAGTLAACLSVIAGGRANTATSVPPTTWLGLQSPVGYRPGGPWVFGLLLIVGIAAIVPCWLTVIRMNEQRRLTPRAIWRIAAGWSLPFVVGPPLISKDVYSYAANGLMLRNGIDVYSAGVSVLVRDTTRNGTRALAAVDPIWRDVRSPYGPLATLLERMSADISGGNPVGAVIVLRAVAVVAVLATVLLARELAAPLRSNAIVLVALNPLVLVHAVSAIHFEAVMCALLLASLVAAKRGRFGTAVFFVCLAGAVKAPAFAVLLPLVVLDSRRADDDGSRARGVVRIVATDLAIACASFGALTALIPNGLGWLHNLGTPGHSPTTSAPSAMIGALVRSIVPVALSDDVTAVVRIAGFTAAGCVVAFLSATVTRRPLAATYGYALLAAAFLLPVFYPWYVLWGAVCLLPTAPPSRRDWVIALCGFESVAAIPGAPTSVTGATNAIVVVACLVWIRRRRVTRVTVSTHREP